MHLKPTMTGFTWLRVLHPSNCSSLGMYNNQTTESWSIYTHVKQNQKSSFMSMSMLIGNVISMSMSKLIGNVISMLLQGPFCNYTSQTFDLMALGKSKKLNPILFFHLWLSFSSNPFYAWSSWPCKSSRRKLSSPGSWNTWSRFLHSIMKASSISKCWQHPLRSRLTSFEQP